MRPVLHGDVVAAARALYPLEVGARATTLDSLLRRAAWADAFRKRTGRVHPVWGDGSLMAVALGQDPPPEPPLSDSVYCDCLAQVFEGLVAWRRDPSRRPHNSRMSALSDQAQAA